MKNKILSLILALTILFSFAACGKKTQESGESASGAENQLPVVANEYIVKNGVSDYEVLYPANANSLIKIAVSEFVNFFEEATKITLRTVSDDKMSSKGKYISIGYTTLLASTNLTYSAAEIKVDGFKIKTVNDDVLIFGANDYGTLYGVYEALGYLFNFEYFFNNCYSLDKGVSSVSLYDFDVVEIPDIEYRAAGYGTVANNSLDSYRLRMRPYPDFFIPVYGVVFHNSFRWVDKSPDFNGSWVATSGDQLCYTAGGSEVELQKMLNASLETLKEHLVAYPDRNVITYTIEDNHSFCSCDSCTSVINEYGGSNSAVVIIYLNKLNKMVKDWFKTEEGKPYERDLDIVFFAYQATVAAPVVYNEATKKYQGINGLTVDKGVSVMYAPIQADYTSSLSYGDNAYYNKTATQWSDISTNLYLWLYSTNFNYYLIPYDSFDGIAENYKIAKEVGTRWIFDQAQWNEYGFSTGWSNLKTYINAKLAWDTSLDMGDLINDFFATYFGPAEKEMREIFSQMRVLTSYNKLNNKFGGLRSIYQNMLQEKFWPKMMLSAWLDLCDKAIEKIKPLENSSPATYRKYYRHISGERIAIYYLFISLYSYNTDEALIFSYKQQFKMDAESLGGTLTSESNGTYDSLYKMWDIN